MLCEITTCHLHLAQLQLHRWVSKRVQKGKNYFYCRRSRNWASYEHDQVTIAEKLFSLSSVQVASEVVTALDTLWRMTSSELKYPRHLLTYDRGRWKDFFQGGAPLDFPRGAEIGEICFFPFETKITTVFCWNFQVVLFRLFFKLCYFAGKRPPPSDALAYIEITLILLELVPSQTRDTVLIHRLQGRPTAAQTNCCVMPQ